MVCVKLVKALQGVEREKQRERPCKRASMLKSAMQTKTIYKDFLQMQNLSLKCIQYTHTCTQNLAQLLRTCERACSRNHAVKLSFALSWILLLLLLRLHHSLLTHTHTPSARQQCAHTLKQCPLALVGGVKNNNNNESNGTAAKR